MADQEQVAILKKGVDAWNAWREENEGVRVDLREADLTRANLTRANLFRADLTGTNLTGADLNRVAGSVLMGFRGLIITTGQRPATHT